MPGGDRPRLHGSVVLRNSLLGRTDFIVEADEERMNKVPHHNTLGVADPVPLAVAPAADRSRV